MEFDDDANLDVSHVQDAGSGGGGGFPGGGMAIGGGAVGLIVTVVLALLGYNTLGGSSDSGSSPNPATTAGIAQACAASNAKRFDNVECRQIAVFDDLRDYWSTDGVKAVGAKYTEPTLTFFRSAVNTACGQATSDVGPFYCPGDQRIYIDLGFYDELASRFGAPGEFAQAYVLAHEFGHHIQYLDGFESKIRTLQQQNPSEQNTYSVALELQADCFAGVWTHNATGGAKSLVTNVSQQDISSAVTAAGAVGDDRLEKQAGQQVNSENWTHGSSAQREQWFTTGYKSGNPRDCNTLKS